jgi:hypothetical protein
MDQTAFKISKLYKKMEQEIEEEVKSLGGVVEEIDIDNKMVNIKVDPELQKHVEELIATIIYNYSLEREKICKEDPFYGIKDLTKKG